MTNYFFSTLLKGFYNFLELPVLLKSYTTVKRL